MLEKKSKNHRETYRIKTFWSW